MYNRFYFRFIVNSRFAIFELAPNTAYKIFVYECHANHQIVNFEIQTKYDGEYLSNIISMRLFTGFFFPKLLVQ